MKGRRVIFTLALASACLQVGSAVSLRASSGIDAAQLKPVQRKRVPPTFPDQYTATYTFTLPYTAMFLPQAMSYPVKLWVDKSERAVRIDTYDGLDTEIDLGGHVYMITPRVDRWVCRIDGNLPEGESQSRRPSLLTGGLPSLDKWEYKGEVNYEGRAASKWATVHRDELKISQYYFIVTDDGEPLYLHMLGSEIVTGAHFDEYEANFTSFQSHLSDRHAFDIPDRCKGRDAEVVEPGALRSMSIHFASLIPDVHMFPSEYDEFAELHNRTHRNVTDRHLRATLYQHHSAFIKQHNVKPDVPYKLAVNKFADWTDAEYRSLLGYRSSRAAEEGGRLKSGALTASDARSARVHRRFECASHDAAGPTPGWMPLPSQVDWRGSGAVGVVKDQAVCGSCWTFSASQAMASAWWLATGDFISLSEQQVMDCSWNYGTNEACDGGDPDMAMLYVVENGGAYAEDDWPYKGALAGAVLRFLHKCITGEDDFCKTKQKGSYFGAKPKAFFKEILRVEGYNEVAVKEALYRFGPLSIGLDANPIELRFYSSGVLWSDTCKNHYKDLDHAVLLVGYGEEAGNPYWIVKNEWSANWGDKGYIKINRRKDCGVATDVTFPVADPEAVKNYLAAKAAAQAR